MCIVMCMRTNIVLDEVLLAEAQKYSLAKSKRALIEEALRTFVKVKAEEHRRERYERRVLAIQRRLANLETRGSVLDILRRDRDGRR